MKFFFFFNLVLELGFKPGFFLFLLYYATVRKMKCIKKCIYYYKLNLIY